MTEDDLDDWMREAACRGAPVDEMFALAHREQRLAAEKWCTGCPVIGACLDDALSHPLGGYGVRGGKSQDDRRLMKRRTA